MGNDEPGERRDTSPEKKHENKNKKDASGTWNWVPYIIPVFALIISLISAYWTVIRRVDALSVFIPVYPPIVFIDDSSGQLEMINLDQNLTFINYGTGAVAVMAEGMSVNDGDGVCGTSPLAGFLYESAPIVIKSGEIQVHELKTPPNADAKQPDKNQSTSVAQLGQTVTVCLYLRVVTSANVGQDVRLPLYSAKLGKSSQKIIDFPNNTWSKYDLNNPITVIYHSGTVFY